ncbi:IS5 family transposase [Sulfurimonas sp.]|uniref:IS5 family transposase n=1 Tax=Sulfurimonas sp. TaxID=2022749 RepID=UPI002B499F1C|nr:IS5 family transposase [Sulfurimonas sp.]
MQLSFFDHAMKYQGGKKSMKFLNEMKEIIPFEAIEKILIEKNVYKPNKGKTGRPSIPSKILVGSLFLQNWYGLSDPMTEELIHDRISFRKFLDIRDEDTIPDETTICKFRNKLIKEEILGDIFEEVKKMMESKRLILNEGTLIDATLIHSSEPKRKKDDKDKVISNKAHDSDATYTSKRGRKHHGLKMHIATDTNGIIKKVIATTASTHDSTQFDKLTEDENKAIFADSGYMQKARKVALRAKGIFAGIVERRVRGQSKLRPKQSRNNTRFSKIRCLVELPFAFIKQHMNFRKTRYRGIEKNQQHFFMLAACYNLRRTPALVRARN